MTKQQLIGLRISKTFPNEEIIEDFYVKKFYCMIDLYLPKRKFAIEVDELGQKDRKPKKENTRQKEIKEYLRCVFIIINLDDKDFSAYDGRGRIQPFLDKLKDEELQKLKGQIEELKKDKESNKKITQLEDEIKELKEELKNLAINQITNNFGK